VSCGGDTALLVRIMSFGGGVPHFCIYVKLVKFLAVHFPKEERGKVHPIYKEEC